VALAATSPLQIRCLLHIWAAASDERIGEAARASFSRVFHQIRRLSGAAQEMPAGDPAGNQPDIATEPTITEQQRLGIAAELRQTAPANSQRISGVAPER
jgi:hypothetical protein